MRIVMFGHKRIPSREGGVEIVVQELATRMAMLDHKVTCYNRGGHHVSGAQFDNTVADDLENIRLKTLWTMDKKGLAAVTSSISGALLSSFSGTDIVHIHAEGPAVMCWLPKLFGKRVVVTVHGLDWQREKWNGGFGAKYIHMGEKMAVRFADEIIVLSKNVQQYFENTYHRKTVMIPNGVTKPKLCDAEVITSKYGIHKNEYILFLGRLVPEKGVHYLIEAYQNVKTEKKLVIAGGTSDSGDYEQRLRDSARGNKNIIFTGFVQGRILEELYSNAYAYVLPSDVEGMPLSLLEAMSYGNCCLSSDIPECVEVIEDHGCTFLRKNIRDLAAKLQQLCDEPDTVQRYKASAREFICGKYNWDDVTAETLKLYRGKHD